jgi:lysophospholipase L1-like esterase
LKQDFVLKAICSIAAMAFTTLSMPATVGADEASTPRCRVQPDLVRLANPLPRMARKLAAGAPITIVAIGSSSTAGAGASKPEFSYPSRLQAELSAGFPRQRFKVINRGINGEEVKDMLRRFDTSVLAEKPDLVLWQLGTNSVLRDHPLDDHGANIREGLIKIKAQGADIVLIDPQFAPKVIAKPDADKMVRFIALAAKSGNVDLFQRFEVMRHWRDDDHIGFEAFLSPDLLHMNDWSYGCLAKSLAAAIVEAATRPVASAAIGFPYYDPF